MSAQRKAKVQRIVELFSSGRYQVDPAAVADAIIRRASWCPEDPSTPSAVSPVEPGYPRLRGVVLVQRRPAA